MGEGWNSDNKGKKARNSDDKGKKVRDFGNKGKNDGEGMQ